MSLILSVDIYQFLAVLDLYVISNYKLKRYNMVTITMISSSSEKMSVPKELFNITQLEYINLNSCSLSEIGDKIINLKNLSMITIENVKISRLSLNISKLPKLSNCFIKFNRKYFSSDKKFFPFNEDLARFLVNFI